MSITHVAQQLAAAGVEIVQYRDKRGSPQVILAHAAAIREAMPKAMTLIMNDRLDLAPLLAEFDGVHLGQEDIHAADARPLLGDGAIVGISTHSAQQVLATRELAPVSYVAIGPVFATSTKADASAVVGLEAVRRARALTTKPLVAIGGITLANAPSVFAAGADSIAVISALFLPSARPSSKPPANSCACLSSQLIADKLKARDSSLPRAVRQIPETIRRFSDSVKEP